MTQMPELVAGFHSLVGLAAVFIGLNADIEAARVAAHLASGSTEPLTGFAATLAHKTPVELSIMRVEVFLGILIGAITFTGSIVAYLKLAGKVCSKPLTLPGRHMINLGAGAVCLILGILYFMGAGIWTMILVALISGFIGWHLIMAIGGADMPVVISMLNSYSGWAAAAIGFTLSNDLLIVTGALVGSSGAILSYIMCKAMNRNFVSVILGGFGGATGPAMEIEGEMVAIDCGRRRRDARRRRLGDHRPGLRHGRRPGPAVGAPSSSAACAPRRRRSASASTPSPAACPAT